MPEFPEVEIVKRSLKNRVKYKKIKKIIINNRNLRFKIHKNFGKLLEGRSIINVSRFSKYIILTLDNLKFCLIHLGMSGTVHIIKKKIGSDLELFFYKQGFLKNLGSIINQKIKQTFFFVLIKPPVKC